MIGAEKREKRLYEPEYVDDSKQTVYTDKAGWHTYKLIECDITQKLLTTSKQKEYQQRGAEVDEKPCS